MNEKKRRTLFWFDYCITPYDKINNCGILCENGMIIAVGGESAFTKNEANLEVKRYKGCYAMPGFIDSHVHGKSINRLQYTNGESEEDPLEEMSRALAKEGVTTFYPTLISMQPQTMLQSVSRIAQSIQTEHSGAEPIMMHLEGPFINPEKRGDQSLENISRVDLGYAKELIAAGQGKIKVMTFAPELPNSTKLIELLLNSGILPSMGHSLASEEETLAAIEAGASRCTYIFNAMPALFHRSSSLTAVALTDDRVSIEIIADGFHLHSTIVKMILKCKKPDKLIAISNAVLGETIPFDNQPAIIRNKYGILSGSNMGLKDIWKNLSTFGNMSEALAAACITANPARDLGLLMRGEIYPGKFADFTLFSVKTNQILGTVKHGKFIFRREDFMES